MRIAIVAPEDLPIPPRRGGSVQIYLTHLVEALSKRRHVTVYLLSPGAGRHGTTGDGNAFVSSTGERISHIVHLRCPQAARLGPSSYQLWVLKTLQAIQPDVVQVDNRPAFVPRLQAAIRAPILLNLHSTTFLGPRHISRAVARQCLQTAPCVVLNSNYLCQAIEENFRIRRNGWNPHVIYPGVDMKAWAKGNPTKWQPGNPFSLLFIGRVIQQKGVHVLVEAVRALRDAGANVTLTIVGRTPPWEQAYRKKLRTASRRLPVKWFGFLPQQQLLQPLAQAHALVMPSQRNEAFGLINLEAMAAGVPVVASAVGGIVEVVHSSCGILVNDPSNPLAFSQAIQSLMASPEQWRRLHRGAKKRAAAFTWERTARHFHHLYESMLKREAD